MRCGQDDALSTDNGMLAHSTQLKLGRQKLAAVVLPSEPRNAEASIGNVVEVIGVVYPSSFTNSIAFVRDCVDELAIAFPATGAYSIISFDMGQTRGEEPIGNDPTKRDFLDTDPRPYGRIFDVDTPGFQRNWADYYPNGTTIFIRYNFVQYSVFGSRRCSNDFPWYSRTTIQRTEIDGYSDFVFFSRPEAMDDNSCGTGYTEIAP